VVGPNADRAASIVQYAFLLAFIIFVAIGTIVALQVSGDPLLTLGRSVEEKEPPEVQSETTTRGPGGGPGGDPGGPASAQVTCGGAGGASDTCTFTLTPTPAEAPTWSIEPPGGFSGSPPTVTFTTPGTRTVRAVVGGTTIATSVTCTDTGGQIVCS
jgi:hypothetical protein